MPARTRLALLVALAGACEAPPPDERYSGGGGFGAGYVERSDAGQQGEDAGRSCPADVDGAQAFGTIAITELGGGSAGFAELLFRAPIRRERVAIELADRTIPLDPAEDAATARTIVELGALAVSGEAAVTIDGVLAAYVCWGLVAPSATMHEAGFVGLWLSPGACALTPPRGETLHLAGSGRYASDFSAGPATPLGCRR